MKRIIAQLAARHLNSEARDKVMSIRSRRNGADCSLSIEGSGAIRSFAWIGTNQFAKRDSYKLFKEKYLPQIKAAADKVASFEGFKEIIAVHAISAGPSHYNPKDGGFIIGITPGARIGLLSIKDRKTISIWKVNEAKARELIERRFTAPTHIFAEEVIELGEVERITGRHGKSTYKIVGTTKSIVLYEDKARTKVLHRFAREDYVDIESIAKRKARAEELASFNSLERVKFANSKYFMAAYARMTGKGLKLADEIVDEKTYRGSPFDIEKARKNERAHIKEFMKREFPLIEKNEPVWVSGHMGLGEYNIKESYFPAFGGGVSTGALVDGSSRSL